MAKLTYSELCDAVELLMQDFPKGVTASQVWNQFFKEQCSTGHIRATLVQLARQGYLVRQLEGSGGSSGKSSFLYKSARKYSGPDTLPRVPAPWPMAALSPKPSLKDVNLKDLSGIISKAIDAVEILQDQVPALLAGLLDLARDCEKLEKVRVILAGMKETI